MLDRQRRQRRWARGLQLLGLLTAIAGLSGFWLNRDVERAVLSDVQREILGLEHDDQHIGFLLAGRDITYDGNATPIYSQSGQIIGWNHRGFRSVNGSLTDTIIYVSLVNDQVTMIALPRDIWLPAWQTAINSMYAYQGIEGLVREVESIVGLPVDYYALINLDIFKNAVDALGGVEVNVPYVMQYRDRAAGLFIDLQAGPQLLDGEDAAGFVRFRQSLRGDIDRLDRVKTLAFAMLNKLQQLNVRAVTVLPGLIDTFFDDVETNASPALIRDLLPRLSRLQIQAATVPTHDIEGSGLLAIDRREVEAFLAGVFGGEARAWVDAPDARLQVVDRSGREGLGEAYRLRLIAMGVPEELLVVSEASFDPSPTRLVVTAPHWEEADYYASLLGVGKQQIDRLPAVGGRSVGLQLILGDDAADPTPHPERLALAPPVPAP